MKLFKTIAVALVVFAWGVTCQAGIGNYFTGAGAADDGDGVVTCRYEDNIWDGENHADQTLTVVGSHNIFSTGHIGDLSRDNVAYFKALTEDDPTVTLRTAMDNDTGFSWTGYLVNIYMNKTFTISNVNVYDPATSEPGWTGAAVGPVTQLNATQWMGQVVFSAGTPIPNGGVLDFGYKLSFAGSAQFCQEMIPIPEPSSIALGIIGLVGLLVVRRKFAR